MFFVVWALFVLYVFDVFWRFYLFQWFRQCASRGYYFYQQATPSNSSLHRGRDYQAVSPPVQGGVRGGSHWKAVSRLYLSITRESFLVRKGMSIIVATVCYICMIMYQHIIGSWCGRILKDGEVMFQASLKSDLSLVASSASFSGFCFASFARLMSFHFTEG